MPIEAMPARMETMIDCLLTMSGLGMTNDWGAALVSTFALMGVTCVVAVLIGTPSAAAASLLADSRCVSPLLDRWRRALVGLWIAGMLFSVATPLILHAAAWESTAGKFGWLIKTVTGGNLLWVGWIHGVHGAAIVALLLYWATRNIPRDAIQHAAMDFSSLAGWWHVRWSMARTWALGGVVLVWLLAATEMSVADLHSVRTIADQFYLFYALDPTWTSIAMTTWIPFLLVGLPAIAWYKTHRNQISLGVATFQSASSSSKTSATFPETGITRARTHPLSCTITIASILLCQGAVAFGLILQTGHVVEVQQGKPIADWSLTACAQNLAEAATMFGEEYFWTLQIACLTSLLVVPISFGIARFARANRRFGLLADFGMMVAFSIPGPIVALAVVRLFASGIPGGEKLATHTLIPTLLAVSVRSGVLAYIVVRIAYSQIADSVWESSRLDGGTWFRMRHVEFPMIWPAVVVAAVTAAVVASGDVPATLSVVPPGVTTVGTRLFGLLHSGSRYQEAALAFWYFGALLVAGVFAWITAKTASKTFLTS